MDNLVLVSSNKIFGGYQKVYSHESSELKCKMNFSIYLPPQAEGGDAKLPVVYYLSGLTCTEQNFISKSGFQRYYIITFGLTLSTSLSIITYIIFKISCGFNVLYHYNCLLSEISISLPSIALMIKY